MKVQPEDGLAPVAEDKTNFVFKSLNRFLIGHSDTDNYSEKWKEEFSYYPSWFDADLSLQLINAGRAKGNTIALYARSFFQLVLYKMGSFIQRNPVKILCFGFLLFTCFMGGLKNVTIETDIVKLWVSQGGRLDEELNFLSRVQHEASKIVVRNKKSTEKLNEVLKNNNISNVLSSISLSNNSIKPFVVKKKEHSSSAPEIPKGNGLGGGFQVVIQTPEIKGENALTKEGLLKHVELMKEIAQYKVEMYGESWTLADICFKTPAPSFPPGPLSGALSTLLEKIIPCIWITPIDCFWDGSKPLGPFPELNLGDDISSFITSLPKGNITWKNLDPTAVIKEVENLFDLGGIGSLFERAGIDKAYLDRPCIDPLDHECPKQSPNYFDKCKALEKFNAWNNDKPIDEKVILEPEIFVKSNGSDVNNIFSGLIGRKKRETTTNESETEEKVVNPENKTSKSRDDDYYTYDTDDDEKEAAEKAKVKKNKDTECQTYSKSLLKWMNYNKDKWSLFLSPEEMPKYPDYGKLMTGGCYGFGKKIMKWPEDLIIGGIERDEHNNIKKAEAFQSVFLVSGAHDVWLRYRDKKTDVKPNLDHSIWTRGVANEIVQAWQRNFTQNLYKHPLNIKTNTKRVFHPLASTSIADMLEEFSEFKFSMIIIGYLLMVIYAGFAQYDWDGFWFSHKSTAAISFLGVLIITYSSIAGLGLATYFGVQFNAATTQIVPFLTLGLGVDDMFLLLHNYNNLLKVSRNNEIGLLMKETGMSIFITSTNNILAFLSGTILPIPALRSFCAQSGILLTFNLITITFFFPAIITLDLRRRKQGFRDFSIFFPCLKKDAEKNVKKDFEYFDSHKTHKDDVHVSLNHDAPIYTLVGLLEKIYLPFLITRTAKVIIITITIILISLGIYGLSNSTLGLELSDVLPEHTAPAQFLKAREQYFSFYPMFIVLKGPNIDFPNQQTKIEALRQDIAKSNFVIKQDGQPSEPYWMSMMQTWLRALQEQLDEAIKKGSIDKETGAIKKGIKLENDIYIARKMICSYGTKFNCTGRIGSVKLIDDSNIINPEGFYNYLTAWYHADNMMYYVSQAAFYPTPPPWNFMDRQDKVIPPARSLSYSQIPFYMTGLIDTPPIVKMIREVRGICENYTDQGLPNFPSGIAFTFWEQYLHLRWHLFLAICTIAGCVFVVVSVIIFNPWAATMVMLIVVSMCIELAGFMGIFGIKLNPVSAVTLITAVGIGVEFTAHVVLAFLTSLGTRNDRMVSCMRHMFIPVMHGALSTLLGIIMLAFSEFEFVVKYFFVVLTALILIGIFNGLAMLPVMLYYIGPPSEIISMDGSDRLIIPESFIKRGRKTQVASLQIPLNKESRLDNEMSEFKEIKTNIS
ncbi:Protein patched homolog 1 [Strongyloides ratti]|uniref:Protein patched homolog 1 n=1 Tax=Strongyloides ratti TaxID=34506 RepID=A0A090LMJ8_STRRB|nr:Protein patched homolog 1 [Strongyloides ratti]CEF68755.1 Protein patched homolog 1 [Strongyloides ratti]